MTDTITLTRKEAQQVLDALCELEHDTFHPAKVFKHKPSINLLRARLAQPEPVSVTDKLPKPEPVAWTVGGLITDFSRDFSAYKTKAYTRPLYTAPPQREWQGLTDAEVEEVECADVLSVRAIEQLLRSKNEQA